MSRTIFKPAAACLLAAGLALGGLVPAQAAPSQTAPKNVIVLVGDGMGYNYLDLHSAVHSNRVHYQVEKAANQQVAPYKGNSSAAPAEDFQNWNRLSAQTNWAQGPAYNPQKSWTDFGWNKKNPTDSAAAGTAMATGSKTKTGSIGLNSQNQQQENLAERAKKLGKKAGVISSVPFSHATPASYSVHNSNREDYTGIASSQLNSNLDVIMGAGHPYYDDNHKKRSQANYKYISQKDYRTLSSGKSKWNFVEKDSSFTNLTQGKTPEKVFGIAQAGSTLQQKRSNPQEKNDIVSLKTMTAAALNVLDNDPDGLFLMVEGGAIDWTGHSNQTDRALTEVEDFVSAIKTVDDWVQANSNWNETLVIVTADHETGYLMGDPAGNYSPIKPKGQGQLPATSWNSTQHTNQLVPFFYKGAGSENLTKASIGRDPIRGKYLDNTAPARWLLDQAWTPRKTR